MTNAEVTRKNRQTRRNERIMVTVGQEVSTMYGKGEITALTHRKTPNGDVQISVKITEAGKREYGRVVTVWTLR